DKYQAALKHFLSEFESASAGINQAAQISRAQTISLNVPIGVLKDWVFMQKLLSGLPSVQNVKQNSFTTKYVNVSLTFNDSIENINESLSQKGFRLNYNAEKNLWEIARKNPKQSQY